MQQSWLILNKNNFKNFNTLFIFFLRANFFFFFARNEKINFFFLLNYRSNKFVLGLDLINLKVKDHVKKKSASSADFKTRPSIVKNLFFFKQNAKSKLLNLFFFLNSSIFVKNLNQTSFYNFFFFKEKKASVLTVNGKKVLLRWENALDLLNNVFFYGFAPLVFSSPFFKKETFSFNWNTRHWEELLWKYYFNFFIHKFNKNTKKFDFFCLKLEERDCDFFIVTDINYHSKNLFFFKFYQFYTIGLSPISTSPWLTSYPIPIFFNSYLIQLFFINTILFIKKNSINLKHRFYKKIFFLSLNSNVFKK